VAYQLTNIDSVDDIHLKFSLKTYYGKSGSIILSERGDLIGIFIGLLKKDSPAVSEKISVKKLDDVFTGFGYSLQSASLNYTSFFRQEHKAGPRIGIKVTEKDKGVFIKEVIDSSPAQRADLRTDDQIMYVNNRFCGNITDLHEAIYQVQGNESVYEITIKRGGKQINKKIELEVSPSPSRDSLNLRGIELISVSSQIKRAFNLEGSPYLVLSVSELSVLHDILMVMDIIIIEDENHLKRLISRIEEGFSSEMHILRNGKRKSLLFER
jgi:C-terminal processing protease CtpA/Prc